LYPELDSIIEELERAVEQDRQVTLAAAEAEVVLSALCADGVEKP
jgi:hypothetical protein